jgi:fructose-1,6-bisphosphatase I
VGRMLVSALAAAAAWESKGMAERLTVKEWAEGSQRPELAPVLEAVAGASAKIAAKIRLAGLDDVYGAAGATNVQGEQQQKLDVFARLVSEEDDEPVVFDRPEARFVLSFDPLDGSSNIDVNVNVGTIFGVRERTGGAGDVASTVLQKGTSQIAAGYVVYGPSTVMVLTVGDGVAAFTLDGGDEFVLSTASWPEAYRTYVAALIKGGKELGLSGKAYGARYIGSLVADFHRTILKGGVFLYPPTAKAPKGKLRLQYEANPLAMIVEQAGGRATDGATRILDLEPTEIHERTCLVIGSRLEVEAMQRLASGAQA